MYSEMQSTEDAGKFRFVKVVCDKRADMGLFKENAFAKFGCGVISIDCEAIDTPLHDVPKKSWNKVFFDLNSIAEQFNSITSCFLDGSWVNLTVNDCFLNRGRLVGAKSLITPDESCHLFGLQSHIKLVEAPKEYSLYSRSKSNDPLAVSLNRMPILIASWCVKKDDGDKTFFEIWTRQKLNRAIYQSAFQASIQRSMKGNR